LAGDGEAAACRQTGSAIFRIAAPLAVPGRGFATGCQLAVR
jgi:hypothetical protein